MSKESLEINLSIFSLNWILLRKNCSFSPVFLLYKYYIIFSNILGGYYCTFHGMIITQQIVGHIKKYWSMIWSWNILSLHTLSWSFTMFCAIKSRLNYQQQKFPPPKNWIVLCNCKARPTKSIKGLQGVFDFRAVDKLISLQGNELNSLVTWFTSPAINLWIMSQTHKSCTLLQLFITLTMKQVQ